jgi:hypothetical protein
MAFFFTCLLHVTMIILQMISLILLLLVGEFPYLWFQSINSQVFHIKLVVLYRCFICWNFVHVTGFLDSCPIPTLRFLLPRACLALSCSAYIDLAAFLATCPILMPCFLLPRYGLALSCSVYIYLAAFLSVWKSSPGTGQRPRPDWTLTGPDR